MQKRRMTGLLAAGTAVLGTAVAVTGAANAAPSARVVADATPAWTTHATRLGNVASSATVHARVYFAPRGGTAELKQFVASVSDPSSANYRHFLSAAQYQQRFGVRDATVSAVSSYLRSQGLKVTGTARNNYYVSVTGTVASAESAFGTQLSRYRHEGHVVQAPSRAVTLPSSIGASVLSVTGLDTTPYLLKPDAKTPPPAAGFRQPGPCSRYYGQRKGTVGPDGTKLPTFKGKRLPFAVCGYSGSQFRSAYEQNSEFDGSGVTVAITDAYASPTIAGDAKTYANLHGDPAYRAGQLTQHNVKSFNFVKACGGNGWYGEESLDVEAVHSMAPGANIEYYGAKNCGKGLIDALQQAADDDTAQIVTNSWDGTEKQTSSGEIKVYENIFMHGEAQGQSFLFSSGDDGDEKAATGTKQVDYPASDPYATSVGGTATGINAKGQLAFQTGWGTDKYNLAKGGKKWVSAGFLYGGGGGTSAVFKRPSYQNGTVTSAKRQVPDVAMDADPQTGMAVGQTQVFPDGTYYDEARYGGTSLASPLFAGFTALTLQASGSPTTGLGLANETIYDHGSAFTDIKGKSPSVGVVRPDYTNGIDGSAGYFYSIRTLNTDSSLTVAPGFDTVTGIGVPNTSWITALAP